MNEKRWFGLTCGILYGVFVYFGQLLDAIGAFQGFCISWLAGVGFGWSVYSAFGYIDKRTAKREGSNKI